MNCEFCDQEIAGETSARSVRGKTACLLCYSGGKEETMMRLLSVKNRLKAQADAEIFQLKNREAYLEKSRSRLKQDCQDLAGDYQDLGARLDQTIQRMEKALRRCHHFLRRALSLIPEDRQTVFSLDPVEVMAELDRIHFQFLRKNESDEVLLEESVSVDSKKRILCLDFDGVIHSYTSPWMNGDWIPDPPVPGAIQALAKYSEEFEVHIYSTRSSTSEGLSAMENWIELELQKEFPGEEAAKIYDRLHFPTTKPPAFVGIDDRVLTFLGEFPSVETLRNFKPWNK